MFDNSSDQTKHSSTAMLLKTAGRKYETPGPVVSRASEPDFFELEA